MKFLVDNMLAQELAQLLLNDYPGTTHVNPVLGENAADGDIWQHALQHDFTILTKDADFIAIAQSLGHPPKVIRLAIGNCTTQEAADLVNNHQAEIRDFHLDPVTGLMQIG